jgi:hypothetical protein
MLRIFRDLTLKKEGQVKLIWREKPWIRQLASRKMSGTLLLYTSHPTDECVLSLIAAHVIQSAQSAPTTPRMIVLYHFCSQSKKNGSEAVVSMAQSLLYQLLSQLDQSLPFGTAQFSCPLIDLYDLMDLFESVLKSLYEANCVICVIDCLSPYCDCSIDHKRAGEVKTFLRRLVELTESPSTLKCRLKVFLTASQEPLVENVSDVCGIKREDKHHVDREALDFHGLQHRFWTDNEVKWT